MAGPDSSHGVSRVVQHKDFYLRGGDVTSLSVSTFASPSLLGANLFQPEQQQQQHAGNEQPGSTDGNAFTLEETTSEDFARFLWVFYNPKYSLYDAPLDTWLSVLKLANRWTFDSVKELSVRELEKLEIEPIEKIAIYHKFNISRLYLVPSYIAVCKRDKSLSFSEGMNLGMETVLRIAEARERLRLQASESGVRSPTFEDFEDNEVETLVREIFNLGSRPTSPTHATSPASGVNGAANGTPFKLNSAPLGNPLKANAGARANGGSAADPRGSSVNSMASIGSVLARQESATSTATPPPATQPTGSPATVPQRTGPPEQRPPVPPVKTTSPSQPATTPLATEKAKEQENPKSGGGLLIRDLPQADSSQVSSSHDVPISRPVVSPTEHSVAVTAKSKDNVNDAEKDKPIKDNDVTNVPSDNEAFKQGGRRKAPKAARGGNK
ncbi:hypothetical protein JVT61DRAFT_630 [Boletus reticuloceps]|uniref:BTB domain-containing protein n=1 Tax=Boletus reticuloceps TaxID=495285 RepID=A0A8I2YYR6_9AGAM|nr:hypothetical protein JVT61DRAFT_630 [Boletus reticuloceps]